ncbi:MAG: purine-nucleoside phosphorylase [Blastocatellia bacterium]|nr:purine-nucleoside phosphorylase [Blastocatellia bacterium]
MTLLYDKASEAARFLSAHLNSPLDIFVVLGSGLGAFADTLSDTRTVDYKEIPHFPVSTVEGHHGRLVFGRCGDFSVAVMQGRFHFYEGYSLAEATLPIRVAQLLGVKRLVVTNSAGGLNLGFEPGDLMVIDDHLNLMGDNPLRGPNDERFGPRFPDMTQVYDPEFRRLAHETAEGLGFKLQQGVYAALSGPSFETPAEIRMLGRLGADAAGMSTAPEAIVARHGGMRVLGISCISNLAAGTTGEPLNHEEVLETGQKVSARFISLLQALLPKLCRI